MVPIPADYSFNQDRIILRLSNHTNGRGPAEFMGSPPAPTSFRPPSRNLCLASSLPDAPASPTAPFAHSTSFPPLGLSLSKGLSKGANSPCRGRPCAYPSPHPVHSRHSPHCPVIPALSSVIPAPEPESIPGIQASKRPLASNTRYKRYLGVGPFVAPKSPTPRPSAAPYPLAPTARRAAWLPGRRLRLAMGQKAVVRRGFARRRTRE